VQPVTIEIDEAIPLPDVDVLKALSRQPPPDSVALEELELSRFLLNEEIGEAVAIDVEQLGAGMLEAS
jgi:hypothetical protein